MKHLEQGSLEAEISEAVEAMELGLDSGQVSDLARYLNRVLEVNQSFNLTAIRDPAEAVRLHVMDSLSALPEVAAAPAGELVDIGSGAGFPGVPLAIVSGRPTVLVESIGKKARFVAEAAAELLARYRVEVELARAEEYSTRAPGRFAVATTRALSALPSVLELAAPLLQVGGVCVAMKGPLSPEELRRGDAAAEVLGLVRVSTRDLALWGGGEARCIAAYRKSGLPKVSLPREVGYAQKRPLA